jgi:hypothetical protein
VSLERREKLKIDDSDLQKTRELCRRPGVLKQQMQASYRVVRKGIEKPESDGRLGLGTNGIVSRGRAFGHMGKFMNPQNQGGVTRWRCSNVVLPITFELSAVCLV